MFLPCVALGAPLLRALFPRAFLDVNREPFELDPQIFDGPPARLRQHPLARVAAGLGTIPRVVGDAQPIYKEPIPVADGLAESTRLYLPYHAALEALIERARAWFGVAILLDCHSMPSTLPTSAGSTSCLAIATARARRLGRRSSRIEPASARATGSAAISPSRAGSSPSISARLPKARHAVQIEINRALYMDERRIVRTERWISLSEDLFAAAKALARELGGETEAGGSPPNERESPGGSAGNEADAGSHPALQCAPNAAHNAGSAGPDKKGGRHVAMAARV